MNGTAIILERDTYQLTNNITFKVSCSFDLYGSTLKGNSNGSVITVGSAGENAITVDMSSAYGSSTITGGSATNGGGINIVNGTVTNTNMIISGNTAANNGGGVYVSSGSTYTAGEAAIGGEGTSANVATTGNGGGIYVGGTFELAKNGSSDNGTTVIVNKKGSVNGTNNNIYLPTGKRITIANGCTLKPYDNNIGQLFVTTEVAPTAAAPVTIVDANATDYANVFMGDNDSDNDSYIDHAYSEAEGSNWKINLTSRPPTTSFTIELKPQSTTVDAGKDITYDVILTQTNNYSFTYVHTAQYSKCAVSYDQLLQYSSSTGQMSVDSTNGRLAINCNYGWIKKNTAYTLCSVKFKAPDNAAAITNGTNGIYRIKDCSVVDQSSGILLTGFRFGQSVTLASNPTQADVLAGWLVQFNSNGGSTVADAYASRGGKVTKPADPTKSGSTFGGWYSDQALTAKYDFDSAVNAAATLYAKWTANAVPSSDYKVDLVGNGGSGTGLSSYTAGTETALPADWTRSGYTFAGWFENSDFSGSAVTAISANATGNKTYYAKWTSDAPINVDAKTTGDTSIKVSWGKVKNAKYYKVYKATKKNGKYKYVGKVKGTSITVKGLNMNKRYFFKVKSVFSNGQTTSEVVSAKTGNVSGTAWFTLTNASGPVVKVKWKSQPGAVGYQVANNHTGSNKIKIKWTGNNSKNTYWSLRKTPGKTYKYKMRYYKVKNGKRVYSSWTSIKTIKVK